MKLWHNPQTRSMRVLWLIEELGLDCELETVEFIPPSKEFFAQKTPTGKLPTFEDDGVLMVESGAIVEYLVEKYGEGRLAPPPGTPERAAYLQWLHFAESTAFPPLGIVVWLTRYRGEAASPEFDALLEDARGRTRSGFAYLESALAEGPYLLGDDFTAADVMMGFTLVAAKLLGALDDEFAALHAYVERVLARPALQRAMARAN